MDKVSIIIVLYNVSAFLKKKRLECVLQQTYSNLEIILVNDGSTDDTLRVCNELADKDNRIMIVNKENGGSGNARNAGMEVATGTFIWFYDVDDDADKTLIEKNVFWMEKYRVDLIIFGYKCITPHLNQEDNIVFKERLIDNNDSLKSIFVDELLLVPNGNGFVWNKFYRKSFMDYHRLRFENLRIQQDEVFNLQFYPKLNHVYISSEVLYDYYIYNWGNTRSYFIKGRYEIYLSIFNRLVNFFNEWDLDDQRLEAYIYNRFYNGIVNTILFNTFHPDSNYSLREKKQTIDRILNLQSTRQCLNYIGTHCKLGVESRLYFYAFKNNSFWRIFLWRTTFTNLRKIKNLIRRNIRKNETPHLHQYPLP